MGPSMILDGKAWSARSRRGLDLPLIEISIDTPIRRHVRLGAPACEVARGRLGKRLRRQAA